MKTSLLILGLSIFGAVTASAQAVRTCANEVLTCRLDKELLAGGKVFLAETSERFSGLNEDEPSIEPSECSLRLAMESGDIIFNVSLTDSDYVAGIYALNKSNLGKILPGDAAFTIVKNKTFYYRYDKTTLSCILK